MHVPQVVLCNSEEVFEIRALLGLVQYVSPMVYIKFHSLTAEN